MSIKIKFFASFFLIAMASLAIFSMKDDSAIMDEVAHIPAGFSYLTQKDMRINPEHPPLLKDLAALPLITQNFNFPYNIKAWQEDINGQWDFGFNFMYNSDNNADKMLFLARLPMVLIMLLLGFFVFKWTREIGGEKAGLLALFLFSFSPTIIAHGRFVTTDVGAAAAFFISIYFFTKWLSLPSKKNLLFAGIALGIAQLAKFSLFLLFPLFVFLIIVWGVVKAHGNRSFLKEVFKNYFYLFGNFIIISLIAYLGVVYPVYAFHVWNYPVERQLNDTKFIMASFSNGPTETIADACLNIKRLGRCPAELVTWGADKSIFRPLSQYGLGLLMVFQRATGGNTTYFFDMVSAAGWWYYFPVVYFLKEPVVTHILFLLAVFSGTIAISKNTWKDWQTQKTKFLFKKALKDIPSRLVKWIKSHPDQFAAISFIFLYWFVSIRSNLNIGVRHVLPTIPFLYMIISPRIIKLINNRRSFQVILFTLCAWYLGANLSIFPSYLAYFNELAGGPTNGLNIVCDSNLDWGQDLKRLKKWVDDYNSCTETKCDASLNVGCPSYCYDIANPAPEFGKPIKKISVHYFGGATVEYYLGDKFISWWGQRDPSELETEFLAVSATLLQGGRANPDPYYDQATDYYEWLNKYEPPTAIIGHSIYVFKIPQK